MAAMALLGLIAQAAIKAENAFTVKVMDGGWPMKRDALTAMELASVMNVMD